MMLNSIYTINTLVFDWGDTLMKVLPQYEGSMANWPEVAVIEGADKTLEQLQQQYRLVVATNAADSGAALVKAALARVELDQYFNEIFTYQELGVHKPEIAFFRSIENRLNESARNLMMVGDNIHSDILSAQYAGWQTTWFNPANTPCPGLLPLHNIELQRLPDLPDTLRRLPLPDMDTCLHWLLEEGASAGVLLHVQAVAAVAYHFALRLRANGVAVDPVLAHRGGLLHDVSKLAAKKVGADHGEMARDFLLSKGQSDLADIAHRHMLFCLLEEGRLPITWEQKVVYFADKLVEGAGVTSLEERLEALKERYPKDKTIIMNTVPAMLDLQNELCQALGLTADEMLLQLQEAFLEKKNIRNDTIPISG
jgi:putative hydrolase of the HAD superfamily